MKKYLQNEVAENVLTLPIAAAFTFVVWLTAGLLTHQWWFQLLLLALTAYLMVELSNDNALLRVRSRMVTSTLLILTACNPQIFSCTPGAIVAFCLVAALQLLFRTYQDQQSMGLTFYAFIFVGVASVFFVQTLLFVPILWILMLTQLQMLSLRTWMASVIGLLTPYWFVMPWIIWQQEFWHLSNHFSILLHHEAPLSLSQLSLGQQSFIGLIVLSFIISAFHFTTHAFEDRIRIRQLFGFLGWTGMAAIILLLALPQLYDPLIRIIIICVSPFVAHYFTLTSSRITNIIFIISFVLTAVVLGINIYEYFVSSTIDTPVSPWSGLLVF